MDLVAYYFQALSSKRAQFQAGPKPLTPWQRISRSFGRGALWGGAQGATLGAIVPQATASVGLAPKEGLGGRTAVGGLVGGAVGATFGGLHQVFEDEMRRRINIEAKKKIIEAQRYEQLAGAAQSPVLDAAALGVPAGLNLPPMGLAPRAA